MRRFLVLATGILACVLSSARAADEFSGADKLRAIYSAEFRFTKEGFPVVPVAVGQGLVRVSIKAGISGVLRLLPEGEGGPDIKGEESWTVQASGTIPTKLAHWAVVWRGKTEQGREADEGREGRRPELSDLRESGSLEQDADLIMFVHREKKKKDKDSTDIMPERDNEPDNPITELIIGKQRNGPTDIVKLVFIKEYTKFELFSGQYDESAMPGG